MITALVLIMFAAIVRKGVLVKSIPNEGSKRNLLEHQGPPVNADWLETPTGERTVAIGLVAIAISLFAFTVQDLSVLLAGNSGRSSLLRSFWYLLWAGLASLAAAACVFICRSAWERLVITLSSVAMASHIVERFVGMRVPQLRLVALCRLLVSMGVVLLYLRTRSTDEKPRIEQ
jgi:hypothetical protein